MRSTPEHLWPLLTHSSMDVPGCFCLGLPRPVSCQLPNASGGVGSERRCVSDRGVIVQKITEWTPPRHLRFEMVSTDHSWRSKVESITEDFQIEPRQGGIRVTRTTAIVATKPFQFIKELGFCFGLKRVHLYVFKNWRSETEQASAGNGGQGL